MITGKSTTEAGGIAGIARHRRNRAESGKAKPLNTKDTKGRRRDRRNCQNRVIAKIERPNLGSKHESEDRLEAGFGGNCKGNQCCARRAPNDSKPITCDDARSRRSSRILPMKTERCLL